MMASLARHGSDIVAYSARPGPPQGCGHESSATALAASGMASPSVRRSNLRIWTALIVCAQGACYPSVGFRVQGSGCRV